jgi:hypothetical protein
MRACLKSVLHRFVNCCRDDVLCALSRPKLNSGALGCCGSVSIQQLLHCPDEASVFRVSVFAINCTVCTVCHWNVRRGVYGLPFTCLPLGRHVFAMQGVQRGRAGWCRPTTRAHHAIALTACLFVFISGTMRFSRYGLGVSSPLQ